jgi:hypothetical protein
MAEPKEPVRIRLGRLRPATLIVADNRCLLRPLGELVIVIRTNSERDHERAVGIQFAGATDRIPQRGITLSRLDGWCRRTKGEVSWQILANRRSVS